MKRVMSGVVAAVALVSALACVVLLGQSAAAEEPGGAKDEKQARRAAIKAELAAMKVPEVVVLPPGAHHIVSELFGVWKADVELTERVNGELGGIALLKGTREGHLPNLRLRFTANPESTARVEKVLRAAMERDIKDLQKYITTLEDDSVMPNYLALKRGFVEYSIALAVGRYDFGSEDGRKGDFAVLGMSGQSVLVLLREGADDDKLGLEESVGGVLQVVRDPLGSNDVLFLSGMGSRAKAGAWVRDGEQPKLADRGEAKSEAADDSAPSR